MNKDEYEAVLGEAIRRPLRYRLEGHEPVPIADDDLAATLAWYEVRWPQSQVKESLGPWGRLSTVFLTFDHNLLGKGPPVLFETMLFGQQGQGDLYCERYHTWAEAEAGHARVLQWLEKAEAIDQERHQGKSIQELLREMGIHWGREK